MIEETSEPRVENSSGVRQRIKRFLTTQKAPLKPLEIANKTGLNPHTVRRELQMMLAAKVLAKNASTHAYALRRKQKQMEGKRERGGLRRLLGQLMDEYAKAEKTYFEFETREKKLERCIRDIKRGRQEYGGIGEVKRLAQALFGRAEHGKLVAYRTEPPEWFVEFADIIKLDEGLKTKPAEELDGIRSRDRKAEILQHLVSDPYLLGDVRDFAKERGNELVEELRGLGMPEEELQKFLNENTPKALKIVYNYWLKQMNWYRRMLTEDILRLERRIEKRKEDVDHALTWVQHARNAYDDLKAQGAAIGVEPPPIPWIDTYEARIRYIGGIEPGQPTPVSSAAKSIPLVQLEEPLPETPVTVRVRKRIQGANPGKHLRMTFAEVKPLVAQGLAALLPVASPAPHLDGITHYNRPGPGKWYVVGRWRTVEDASEFLTDEHHAEYPDSDYWTWKKAGAEFAVLHWQGQYWPAVRIPVESKSDNATPTVSP